MRTANEHTGRGNAKLANFRPCERDISLRYHRASRKASVSAEPHENAALAVRQKWPRFQRSTRRTGRKQRGRIVIVAERACSSRYTIAARWHILLRWHGCAIIPPGGSVLANPDDVKPPPHPVELEVVELGRPSTELGAVSSKHIQALPSSLGKRRTSEGDNHCNGCRDATRGPPPPRSIARRTDHPARFQCARVFLADRPDDGNGVLSLYKACR